MCRILSSNPSVLRRWGLIFGSIAALLFAATEARADDTHYRGIPIGAKAIGLGGAFTGVADDVSAAYFNPAGLALPGSLGIAAGLTINAWQRDEIQQAFTGEQTSQGLTTKSSRTVPIFVGAGIKFGPRDEEGDQPNSLAVSTLQPIFSAGNSFLQFPSQPLELSDSYRLTQADRGTWYGISYARRFNPKHSFGASLYLSTRRLNHSEVGLSLDDGTQVGFDPSVFEGVSSTANNQDLSFKVFHFVMRFGWLHQLKPQVRLGVMVQLPGIPLKQKVSVFSQGFINDNRDTTMPLTEAYYLDQNVGARLPIPGELAVGVWYQPAEKVTLSLNAWAYTPVPSHNRVDISETVPVGGFFFDNDTKRLATGNVAVAGDFRIRKELSMTAAFFTDLSSAAKIPSDPTRYQNPRTQRFGGTLSVGLNVAGISLAIGSTFIYGRGDATGVVVDFDNLTASYTRTQETSRIVYLHLTGATQAVVNLGGKAEQGIQERRAKKKNGDH